jgi:hypothetical protein
MMKAEIIEVVPRDSRGRVMTRKLIQRNAKLQDKVGSLFRKAAAKGDMIPRELLGVAFSNVGKVRRDVLDIVFQEFGRYLENFADNYSIKIRAELNFERKKPKSGRSR